MLTHEEQFHVAPLAEGVELDDFGRDERRGCQSIDDLALAVRALFALLANFDALPGWQPRPTRDHGMRNSVARSVPRRHLEVIALAVGHEGIVVAPDGGINVGMIDVEQ